MFGEESRGVGEGEVKNGKKRNKLDKRAGLSAALVTY